MSSKSASSILSKLGDAWNMYIEEYGHQANPFETDQLNDFRKAIHDAQRIVATNHLRQINPEIFEL